MRVTRRARLFATVAALAALAAAPAGAAAQEHQLQGSIGIPFPTPPEMPAPLEDACGVALHEGLVYVSNYYQHAIYVFGSSYITQYDLTEPPHSETGKSIGGPCDLAFDSAGNLYVNNWHADVVRFPPPNLGSTSLGSGVVVDSNHPTGVAVDPSDDHVFVDDRTSIAEYAPGALENAEPLRRIGVGEIAEGYGVAVSGFAGASGFPSTAGWVYVADAASDTVKAFDSATEPAQPEPAIDGSGLPGGRFNDLVDTDIAVDPRDGHVYVVDNLQPGFEQPEAVLDEFSSLGRFRGAVQPGVATGHGSGTVDAEPSSVAISPSGEIFLTSGNLFNANPATFRAAEVQVFSAAEPTPTDLLTATKSGAGSGTVFSSDPAGLRCGTACVGEFPPNRTIVLVAEPDPRNRFVAWSGCPDPLPNGRCSLALNGNATVDAEFEPVPQRTLSVSVGGAGRGSVASTPAGIDCGGACSGEFDEGSQVTLTATAFAGSAFAGWSGCESEPAAGTCTVTMSALRSVGAEFEPIPVTPLPPPPPPPARTLSVAATGLGGASGSVISAPAGIDCGATCAGLYANGTTVMLEAHPADGSTFIGWGGCDSSAGARCTITLGADETVVAAFGPGSPGPLRVRGVTVRGEGATLRVAVPAPGELSASSPQLQPASALPIEAGTVALRLKLSAAGAHALACSKRHRLAVPVALELAPFAGGSPVTARRTVTFGAVAGSGRRQR